MKLKKVCVSIDTTQTHSNTQSIHKGGVRTTHFFFVSEQVISGYIRQRQIYDHSDRYHISNNIKVKLRKQHLKF